MSSRGPNEGPYLGGLLNIPDEDPVPQAQLSLGLDN
jgi:hypothetical protein